MPYFDGMVRCDEALSTVCFVGAGVAFRAWRAFACDAVGIGTCKDGLSTHDLLGCSRDDSSQIEYSLDGDYRS